MKSLAPALACPVMAVDLLGDTLPWQCSSGSSAFVGIFSCEKEVAALVPAF